MNPRNLKLPFWLFNFEEIIDVFFGGRPGLEEEVDILAEHRPYPPGHVLGLQFLVAVGLVADLEVEAPHVVGLGVQQRGAAAVERLPLAEPHLRAGD